MAGIGRIGRCGMDTLRTATATATALVWYGVLSWLWHVTSRQDALQGCSRWMDAARATLFVVPLGGKSRVLLPEGCFELPYTEGGELSRSERVGPFG